MGIADFTVQQFSGDGCTSGGIKSPILEDQKLNKGAEGSGAKTNSLDR